MNDWITNYIRAQKAALDSISATALARWVEILRRALAEDRQIFVFGNGGSAANASHFATDLGKGASAQRQRELDDRARQRLRLRGCLRPPA
jgi:D-sedoheptulose 7-phosphate isomerase